MKNDVVRWTSSARQASTCNNSGSVSKHHKSRHASDRGITMSSESLSSLSSSSSDRKPILTNCDSGKLSADSGRGWRPIKQTRSASVLLSIVRVQRRPRAFNVNTRTDFTKFLALCLQISVVLCLCSSNVGVVADDSELEANPSTQGGHYTHTWAVHVPNGDEGGLIDQVARDHGFINLGKVS